MFFFCSFANLQDISVYTTSFAKGKVLRLIKAFLHTYCFNISDTRKRL